MPTQTTPSTTVSNMYLNRSQIRILIKGMRHRLSSYKRFGSYEESDLLIMETLLEYLVGAENTNIFIFKHKYKDLSYAKIQHIVKPLMTTTLEKLQKNLQK